jgi:hypothetical protein
MSELRPVIAIAGSVGIADGAAIAAEALGRELAKEAPVVRGYRRRGWCFSAY